MPMTLDKADFAVFIALLPFLLENKSDKNVNRSFILQYQSNET